MDYPGNATLTREMQERILSTFKQTLTAAAAGNQQEAKLGCDFILRLDSLFGPARELLERMEGSEGRVPTADLAAIIGMETPAPEPAAAPAAAAPPAAAEAVAPPPDIDDLSDLDLEMGLSDPVPAPPGPAAAAPPAAEPPAEAPTPPPAEAPTPPPAEAAAPEAPAAPPAPPPPEVDQLDDLDLGDSVDAAPEPPPPAAEPEAPPAPEPPATEPPPAEPHPAATPETAAVEPPPPADPEIAAPPPIAESAAAEPEAPGLDELDDLDLGLDAEPAPPPAEETTPEAPVEESPAPPEPPPAEEATDAAPAASEAPAEEPPAEEAETPAPAPPQSMEIPLDSEPAAQLDSESQQRVADLLAEGQAAFDSGEYQGAIDAWSRIFLIDIDHPEANERIEEARKLKAEADRKVEERFHEGLSQLEAGDAEAAKETFRAVVEMQPSHLAARDYLEKLEAGEVPVPTELPKPAEAEPGAELEPEDIDLADEMDEAPKSKPDRGTKAVGESMVSVKKSPLKSKAFLGVAAAGLIVVLSGVWYLFDNWSSLFPNSAEEAPTATTPDPLARAKALHDEGKTPIAIAQLRRLPPASPQYDEAQALIAQWELEQTPADMGAEGPSPEELARRGALVAEAGAAADRGEFLRTSELLSEAAAIAPLSGAEVQLLARADEQLQELQNFITLFREGEWDLALRDLWLLHESDPRNRDVTRLLTDSYYNLGLRSLQRQDLELATEQLKEAQELSPDDPEIVRLADFAATYQTRSTDLLYRIFVKYHRFR